MNVPRLHLTLAGKVADFEKRPDLKLVTNDIEVAGINEILGTEKEGFNTLLIKEKDGEIAEAFGIRSNVPRDKEYVFRIKRGK